MNRSEVGSRIGDFMFGRKVEGKVSAVLREDIFDRRYIVTTEQGALDVLVPKIKNYGYYVIAQLWISRPPLKINERLSLRIRNVKPWVDGQQI